MAIPDIIQNPEQFAADPQFWLHAAQEQVRAYCGWHVTPNARIEGSINHNGGNTLRLPALHVTNVESLTDRQGKPIPYAYDPETGLVERTDGKPMPTGVCAVKYVIDAGWDNLPDVQSVVLTIAKRAATAANGQITSQSVNGSSVSYALAPMADELAKLNRYKVGVRA